MTGPTEVGNSGFYEGPGWWLPARTRRGFGDWDYHDPWYDNWGQVSRLAAGLLGMLPFGGVAPIASLVLWFFLALTTWASIMLYRRLQTTAPSPV